jgi:hypothetical protein
MYWPETLRKEAKDEVYSFIDKYYKESPKNADGTIKELGSDFADNDIDALRHAYVSGVFTQQYGEKAAEIFGRLNEWIPGGGSSSSNNAQSENMDLWNNAIGRKYGKKTSGRLKLFKLLLKALKNNELIINPSDDQRKYDGKIINLEKLKSKVVVIKESKKGKNLLYLDVDNSTILAKSEFILQIKDGQYPRYEIRTINGEETPVSKKDNTIPNNLG